MGGVLATQGGGGGGAIAAFASPLSTLFMPFMDLSLISCNLAF